VSRPTTVTGRELYDLLPTVYRVRDADGHLGDFLDACGTLLDRLRATLEQRYADAFPASPAEAMPAQSWLLPYFADLLDVRLLSPLVEGRRGEVARAIAWRQRKGTLATLEEIAETVGGFEVETQEGWYRVAVTPRVDRPLLPAAAFGEASEPDRNNPLLARRHPALPVTTVDVTLPSRAIAAPESHPRSKVSRFRGERVSWRQLNPHGVPCFPGSFEDASRRVPDVRTPGPSRGFVHPRRLLLFVPPATGFFPFPQPPDDIVELLWSDRDRPEHRDHVDDSGSGSELRTIVNPSRRPDSAVAPVTVVITSVPGTFNERRVVIEDLAFEGVLRVSGGHIELRGVTATRLEVDTADLVAPVIDAVDCVFEEIEAPDGLVRLEATTVNVSLAAGRVELKRVALKDLTVATAGVGEPVIDAVDCLFDGINAEEGLVRLEASTVMQDLSCRRLQASDCLFAGDVELQPRGGDPRSCVRYSRVPRALFSLPVTRLERAALTTVEPIFFAFDHCAREGGMRRVSEFGDPGYGVLHPATPDAISSGAEDGGELGADHHRATCLARAAVLAKLASFLPLGIEAVLVPDPRLLVQPPDLMPEESEDSED
jgi:hypothetical protein